MAVGTIALTRAPKRKKIYGRGRFHLKPRGSSKGYHFALRPVYDYSQSGHPYMIEGEFGTGKKSLEESKKQSGSGMYKNVRYVYYREDLDDMDARQKHIILKWAKNGEY